MSKKITDKERLDWLTMNKSCLYGGIFPEDKPYWWIPFGKMEHRTTPRQAIDAAIKSQQSNGGKP